LVADVHGRQGFQALAQGWVSGAHDVQKSRTQIRRFFQRERNQHFFPVLRQWHVCLRFAQSSLHAHSTD
jgi:hypothetical protein